MTRPFTFCARRSSARDWATSDSMGKAILLTGNPGCGKTTLIQRVIARLAAPAGGFYTQEIREQGVRKGFEIVTLDERRGILAHVDIHSPKKINKYGVNISALDEIAATTIRDAVAARKIVIIDEIGPMEILSERFCQAVMHALQSDTVVFGTIVKRNVPFTDQIKAMPTVTLIEVRRENREALLDHILTLLEKN
jgi:nucleoside-triphosphatase